MSKKDEKDPFAQLNEKMAKEIEGGHPYEALQLVQSFLARKRKNFGYDATSALVYHGCKILIEAGAPNDAGSLLQWYIEDGAGDDYSFKLEDSSEDKNFCDVKRLLDFFNQLTPDQSYPIVEKMYGPLHKAVVKKSVNKASSTYETLQTLELKFIEIFELNRAWSYAYKAVVRLGDLPHAAKILDLWANEGYATEYPLFFARAVLHILAEGNLVKATELLNESKKYIDESVELAPNDSKAASFAVWHFTLILVGVANMEPKPRVDKAKIYGILTEKYSNLILSVDRKIILLFEKIGKNLFGIAPATSEQSNPMAAMFQSMLSAGGNSSATKGKKTKKPSTSNPPPPAMDVNAMMSLLSKLQT
jgi:hypothetical protein